MELQQIPFLKSLWQLTHVDGCHEIRLDDALRSSYYNMGHYKDQHQIIWEHGLYADEDFPPDEGSYGPWDEAHAMALLMRNAAPMYLVLRKLQEHWAVHGVAAPPTVELLEEINAVVQRSTIEDEFEAGLL